MTRYFVFVFPLCTILACKCPQMAAPAITKNAAEIPFGDAMILTVPEKPHIEVRWHGPDSSHTGNPWIRPFSTVKMSGTYKAVYVCRNKAASDSSMTTVNILTCPSLPAPTIVANSNTVELNSNIVLSAAPIGGTTVVWEGPAGLYWGNQWEIPNANTNVAGMYKAYYFYDRLPNCHSPKDSLPIVVYNPLIKPSKPISYNGRNYDIILKWKYNYFQIWLTPDPPLTSNASFLPTTPFFAKGPMSNISVVRPPNVQTTDISINALYDYLVQVGCLQKMTFGDFKQFLSLSLTLIDKTMTYVGCVPAGVAAGCTLMTAESAQTLLPVCLFFSAYAEPGAKACFLGAAGQIAGNLYGESAAAYFGMGSSVIDLRSPDVGGMFMSAMEAAVIQSEGGAPAYNGGGFIFSGGTNDPGGGYSPPDICDYCDFIGCPCDSDGACDCANFGLDFLNARIGGNTGEAPKPTPPPQKKQ